MAPEQEAAEARRWLRTHCVLCWQELSGATLARVTDDCQGVLACHAAHGSEARGRGFVVEVQASPRRSGLPDWAAVR